MTDDSEAERAIAALNGADLDGQRSILMKRGPRPIVARVAVDFAATTAVSVAVLGSRAR